MNNRDIIILTRIIQYTEEIETTVKRYELNFFKFSSDFVVKNAIAMCVLQIGELVGKLTEEFKIENNAMPWNDIKAMRNITAHNYGEIDLEVLWEILMQPVD